MGHGRARRRPARTGDRRHRHTARVLRGRRQRRARPTCRAGRLRRGTAGRAGPAGLRRAGRARPRLRLALRPAPTRDRSSERGMRRRGPRARALLRPALRVRFSANDDGRSKAGPTGRIRNELGATPARRRDPSRRPPPVGAGRSRPERRSRGACGTASSKRGGDARGRPWVRPQPDRTGIAQLCDRDQAAALRRPAPPRRGRSSRGLEVVAPLHDGCRRLPGGRRRAARAPRPRWP